MNTLMGSSKGILELLRKHISLFDSFDHVYLFGSTLTHSTPYSDIDVLVIYSEYSSKISNDLRLISDILGKSSDLSIDLTALSLDEEKEIAFLEKIKHRYIKLK